MEQEQIREQVEKLNRLFNIRPCKVCIKRNPMYGNDASYDPYSQFITFNEGHLDRITPSLVAHEFAHHLVSHRQSTKRQLQRARKTLKEYTKRTKTWNFGFAEEQKASEKHRLATVQSCRKTRRTRQIHHGDDFVMCLKQIIRKTGMDYSTDREYITVAKKLRGNANS